MEPSERQRGAAAILKAETFRPYVEGFNTTDDERYVQHIPNAQTWDFLKANIPLFECPDRQIEEIYYFRWWTFRKHIRQTDYGFVLTEFLAPVRHAGPHNTVSCALGHHITEGRWLRDSRYLDQDVLFWLRGHGGKPQPHLHHYSSWLAHALLGRYLVDGRRDFLLDLHGDLVADYRQWEQERLGPDGLFWQYDVQDGMEESISGSRTARNARPSINSYMAANARAIAQIARLAGRAELAEEFQAKASRLGELVWTHLWDAQAKFFKTRLEGNGLADVRELIGYTPWSASLPACGELSRTDGGYEEAWRQLLDEQGFSAPFGPTTAERRHPKFTIATSGGDDCQWNGPSWPFATSMTLTALANLLNDYRQDVIAPADYFRLLKTYTACHRLTRDDGTTVPWIDENLDPFTGRWLARHRKKARPETFCDRGKDYNHSTYCDLITTGLVGLRPRADNIVEVNPLVPAEWDWFCLNGVPYHGRSITVLYDRTGTRYGREREKGLAILADGRELARRETLGRLTGTLPAPVE